MTKYTCPKGHIVETTDEQPTPTCRQCKITATSYNPRIPIVYSWLPTAKLRRMNEALQDAMDEAFDHQYFDEW